MMMPEEIRDGIRDKLWNTADEIGWSALPDVERAQYYERWTKDAMIGGKLAHFMDPRKVRVYIKDSLIKPYERERLSLSEAEVLRLLEIPTPADFSATFIKPHGRRLADGRVVSWGKSRDWKFVLMATFERGHEANSSPFAVVLLESGKTADPSRRALVKRASDGLGIAKLAWIE